MWLCLDNTYKYGSWRKASRSPTASLLLISFCLTVHYSSCCREGRQPVFSVQRWLLRFPRGKRVLTGKFVSQHAYHGYAQSMGRSTKRPGLPSFRGSPKTEMEHRLTSKLFGCSVCVARSHVQNPVHIYPKLCSRKKSKNWGGREG